MDKLSARYNLMRTRNGVYYDLAKSTYKFKVPDTNITYVFSSDLHLEKFEEQYKQNRHEIMLKIKARFKVNMGVTTFADLILYMRIERRGFLVVDEKGVKTLCADNLILGGEKVTQKS